LKEHLNLSIYPFEFQISGPLTQKELNLWKKGDS